MHSIYAVGSRLLTSPLSQSVYRVVAQEHISRLLVSAVFTAALTCESATDKMRDTMIHYMREYRAACQVKNLQPMNIKRRTFYCRVFSRALCITLIKHAATAAAFTIAPLMIHERLKKAAFSLPFFGRIAGAPVIRSLSLSHVVCIIAGVQTLRHVVDTFKQVHAKKQSEQPTRIAQGRLEKVGKLLSVLACNSVAIAAFTNTGSWKQKVGALCILAVSGIGGLFASFYTSTGTDGKGISQRDVCFIAGTITCVTALLTKSFTRLAWLPQAEVNTVAAGLSLFNAFKVWKTL